MKKYVLSSLLVVVAAFVANTSLVPAQSAYAGACDGQNGFFVPRWYDDLCKADKKTIMSPADMGGGTTAADTGARFSKWVGTIAMNIVKMLLVVVGYVSLAFIIWGGFKYMTAGDNSSGTVAARKTIMNAVIGLIISIMSVAIINLVTGAIVA